MSAATDSVIVTTVVTVDPTTAFRVFTEEVDAWWKRGPRYRHIDDPASTMRFEPRVGGRLLEVHATGSGEAYERGRVLVWQPGGRLVYETAGRDMTRPTEVEIRFEAVDAGTRVTVEQRGFDAIPADAPVRHGLAEPAFIAMMGSWWADLLAAHRACAQGQAAQSEPKPHEAPTPAGPDRIVLGGRR